LDNLAPIVLFVYNRLEHTKQTIGSLQKNELALQSELFIYSDEAKNENARTSVDEVRKFINSIDGFKKITIIKREKNWGLADSIIDGVTKIVNEYGKIIVLEDDLVTSPYFLKFMNEALEFYKNKQKVWHISGWNYPYQFKTKEDIFLWRVMDCWGWATWSDRWICYEKNTNKLIDTFSKEDIYRFNIDDNDKLWNQVIDNKKKKINTWAIYWYASIFTKQGLCVNPVKSYVQNIGLDGTGEHCSNSNNNDNILLNYNKDIKFTKNIIENKNILQEIKYYYRKNKKSIIVRIINKIFRILLKRNVIK
jgi:hypothetical protein